MLLVRFVCMIRLYFVRLIWDWDDEMYASNEYYVGWRIWFGVWDMRVCDKKKYGIFFVIWEDVKVVGGVSLQVLSLGFELWSEIHHFWPIYKRVMCNWIVSWIGLDSDLNDASSRLDHDWATTITGLRVTYH